MTIRAPRRPARLVLTGAVGLVVLLVATGCALRPGTAVEVGGETISGAEVDAFAEDLCAFSELQPQAGPVPIVAIRQNSVLLLTTRVVTDRAIEETDAAPGDNTASARQQLEQTLPQVPEELQDFFSEQVVAQGRNADVVEQLGPEGYADFVDGLDVEIDPRYDLSFDGGQPEALPGASSVPASETALAPLATELDPAYVESLPPDQLCGG